MFDKNDWIAKEDLAALADILFAELDKIDEWIDSLFEQNTPDCMVGVEV